MSDLERLARALWIAKGGQFVGWDDIHENGRRIVTHQVRAVLTALREPSEAMLDAGWDGVREGHNPRPVWQAMIDAVLSDAE